jgi:cobalamin biosynthesis Mg chelatase CobN
MVSNSPDIAPWPRTRHREENAKQNAEEQEKAEQEAQNTKKKAEKKIEKAQNTSKKDQSASEETVVSEETVTSEEIMASEENVSTASESMVVTTEVPESLPIAETSQTATPVGVILAVCASLLICLGSAWLYRSRRLAGRNID